MICWKEIKARCALAATVLALAACGGGGSTPEPAPQAEPRVAPAQADAPITGAGIHLLAGATTMDEGSCGWVDGTRSQARLGRVVAMTVGSDGTVYVAEASGSSEACTGEDRARVRKITPDGEVSTLAVGQGPEAGAFTSFLAPSGIAVDAQGNVYVSDEVCRPFQDCVFEDASGAIVMEDGRAAGVWRIAPDGQVTILAGVARGGEAVDGVGTGAQFRRAQFVAFGGDGRLYVFDPGYLTTQQYFTPSLVRRVALDGTVTTMETAGGLVPNPLHMTAGGPTGDYWMLGDGRLVPTVHGGVLTNVNTGMPWRWGFSSLGPFAFDNAGGVWFSSRSGDFSPPRAPVVSQGSITVGDRDAVGEQIVTGPLPGSLLTVRAVAVGPDDSLYIASGQAVLRVIFD